MTNRNASSIGLSQSLLKDSGPRLSINFETPAACFIQLLGVVVPSNNFCCQRDP